MSLEQGPAQATQQQPESLSIFQKSSSPVSLIFLLLFRTLALLFASFLGNFLSSISLRFVLIILLLAFDFWTVKNVSGRLLVGLRWWNEIREDGSNEWIFESKENRQVNASDSFVFWTVLYVYPALWIIWMLASLMSSVSWVVISLIGFLMTATNLVGYIRCEKDYKKKAAQYITQQGFVQNMMTSAITSRLFG